MNVRIHRTKKPLFIPKQILNDNLPMASIGLFILLAEVYREDCYTLNQILMLDELKSESKENIINALEKLVETSHMTKEESADKVIYYYLNYIIEGAELCQY